MFKKVLLTILAASVFSCDKEEDKRASVSEVNENNSSDTEVPSISSRVDQSISLLFDAAADIEKASKDYDKVSGGLSLSSDGAVDTLAKNAVALKTAATTLDKEMKEAAASEKDLKDLKPKEVSAENVKATETALNSAKSLFYKKLADFQELGGEAKNLSSELIEKSEEADTKMDAAYAKEVAAQRERSQVESNMRTLKQAVMDDLEKRQGAADKLKKETDQFANAQKGLSNVTEEVDEDVEELKETNDELSKTNSKLTANQTVLKNYTTSLKTTVTKTDTEVLQGLQTSLVTFKNTIDDLSGTTDELSQIQVRHSSLLAALLSGPVAVIMQEISRLQGAVDILTSLINNETRSDIRSQLTSVKNTVAASVRNLNTAIADIQANIATQQKLSGTAKTTLDRQRKIVVDQNLVYKEQSGLVNQLKELVEEQKKLLASQESAVKRNDALIASQKKILADQAKIIAELDEKVDQQKNYIASNKNYLAQVTKFLGEEFVRIKEMREKLAQIPDPTGVIEVCTRDQFIAAMKIDKAKIKLTCDIDMEFKCPDGKVQKTPQAIPSDSCSESLPPYVTSLLALSQEIDGNGHTIRRLAYNLFLTVKSVKNLNITEFYENGVPSSEMQGLFDNVPPSFENVFVAGMLRNVGFFDMHGKGEFQAYGSVLLSSNSQNVSVDLFSAPFAVNLVVSAGLVSKNNYVRLSTTYPPVYSNTYIQKILGENVGDIIIERYFRSLSGFNSVTEASIDNLTISFDSGVGHPVWMLFDAEDGLVNGLSIVAPKDKVDYAPLIFPEIGYRYIKNGVKKTTDFHTEIDVSELFIEDPYNKAGGTFNRSRSMPDFQKSGNDPSVSVIKSLSNSNVSPNNPYTHIGSKVGSSSLWYTPASFTHTSTPAAIPMMRNRLKQEAEALDRFYGFRADGANYSLNKFGKNEKWLRDAAGYYFFIHGTNKALYRYKSGNASTFLTGTNSTFIAYLPPEYYADPKLLIDSWARESNLERVLKFKSANKPVRLAVANDQLNAQGYREKWFKVGTQFYFVVPNGSILKWDGSVKTTDQRTTFPRNSELILTAGKELYYNLEYLF